MKLRAGILAKYSEYSHQKDIFFILCVGINTKEGCVRISNRHKVIEAGSNQVIIMQIQERAVETHRLQKGRQGEEKQASSKEQLRPNGESFTKKHICNLLFTF